MVDYRQAVAAFAQPEQSHPQQRRVGKVETVAMLLVQHPTGLGLLGLWVQARQIDNPPRQLRPARNQRHRAALGGAAERRPQIGVAVQQGLGGGLQAGRIHRALQVQHGLDDINIRPVSVELGQKQKSFLQRRQREYVFKFGLVEHGTLLPSMKFGGWLAAAAVDRQEINT